MRNLQARSISMILQIELDTFRVIYKSRDGLEYERFRNYSFLRHDDREQGELASIVPHLFIRGVSRDLLVDWVTAKLSIAS